MGMTFETLDRPDSQIQQNLLNQNTPFKKVPLPTGDENKNFQETLASERYKQVIQNLRHYNGPGQPLNGNIGLMPLMMEMMMAHNSIVLIERNNRKQLEDLSIEVVKREMGIPDGALLFDAKIIDMGSIPSDDFNRDDEDEENEEIDYSSPLSLEKAKRRMVNSIIQGSSKRGHYLFHSVENEVKEITGNENIIEFYGTLMSINDSLYWQLDTSSMMSSGGESIAGKVEIDRNTTPPTIRVRAINFPVLIHELIKGIMELFSLQGRPDDQELDSEVEESEDTLDKEFWDLRLGPPIWDRLRKQFPDEIILNDSKKELQNFLLVEIFKLPARKFLVFMKEVLNGTENGNKFISLLMNRINNMLENDIYDDSEVNIPNIDEFTKTIDYISENTSDESIEEYLIKMGFDPNI